MSRWLPATTALGLLGVILWLERRAPLRPRRDPGPRRLARNAAVAAVTASVVLACERPVIRHVVRQTERRRWGLLPQLALPAWIQTAAALLLMDYTLYWWHILLHRVPALWRLHVPHHADLDLDASTALRFHFAEFLASIPWRAAQVLLIGVNERTLSLWQRLTLAEVVFHHSNLRLPVSLDRWLSALIVTPRLHGMHHSIVLEERDSNFSSGLTVWDVVHGTLRRNGPAEQVTIGLPDFRSPAEVTLRNVLVLPFVGERS